MLPLPAFTVENIMVALSGIEERWNTIGYWLYVPEETMDEIRKRHSNDSERLKALILYTLTLHPRSSWRCVIRALHGMEKQAAKRIEDYSEFVTGMQTFLAVIPPCGVRLD